MARDYSGQLVVFLEQNVDHPVGSRYDRWWAAYSGGSASLPLVMADSGHQISNGSVSFYNVYKGMVDAELARAVQAYIAASCRRVGNRIQISGQMTNLSGVTLSSSGNVATIHAIVYEDAHVGVTDRYVRTATSTGITSSLTNGSTMTFTLETSDLTGVNWDNLHTIVLADYRPGGSSGAYDMLQATIASWIVEPSNRCDFNGDGKTDILWRNKSTGQNVVWLMNGTALSSYVWIDTVADTNWEIVGTGDFNGDGKTDILWRNKSTGQNVVWLMNGTALSSYVWIDTVADTNWEIVGTGDFNGDGKTDILWRNKSTGQNVVWLMNGTALSSYVWIDTVADTNWEIVGTGDFNGEGKVAILWRNKSTGQNVVWFMNGAAFSSYVWIDTVTDTNWQIVGTGDFTGDGKTDILWRNKSTGQNVIWLMNGTAFSSYSWIDTVADTNWEIVGPK